MEGINGPILRGWNPRHPRGPVSLDRSNMAGRAPNEGRSRLFKPCYSTCSSGALHLLNWPGLGCHNTSTFLELNSSCIGPILKIIRIETIIFPKEPLNHCLHSFTHFANANVVCRCECGPVFYIHKIYTNNIKQMHMNE